MSAEIDLDPLFDGIVIRAQASGDADLILTVLGGALGKCSVIAKQARQSRKRFASSFDVFDAGRFELKHGRGPLPLVHAYIPGRSFRRIRESLDKLALASLLCEGFDFMVHEAAGPADDFHALLQIALTAIDEAASPRDALRATFHCLSKLLEQCGYLDATVEPVAGAKNFITLLALLERCAERKLRTRNAVEEVLNNAATKRASPAGAGRPPRTPS